MLALFVISITAVALVSAQSSISNPEPSATFDVAPAATTVPAEAYDAELPLLKSEVVQVTDEVLADLLTNNDTASYADLFAFADSDISTESAEKQRRSRRSSKCKTAPGDLAWPSKVLWVSNF